MGYKTIAKQLGAKVTTVGAIICKWKRPQGPPTQESTCTGPSEVCQWFRGELGESVVVRWDQNRALWHQLNSPCLEEEECCLWPQEHHPHIMFCEGVKYLFDSLKCKSIDNFFWKAFSGLFCCYSVSHCSNKPTIKIIDWSFLCQWANVQNQQGIKFFFFPTVAYTLLFTSYKDVYNVTNYLYFK